VSFVVPTIDSRMKQEKKEIRKATKKEEKNIKIPKMRANNSKE